MNRSMDYQYQKSCKKIDKCNLIHYSLLEYYPLAQLYLDFQKLSCSSLLFRSFITLSIAEYILIGHNKEKSKNSIKCLGLIFPLSPLRSRFGEARSKGVGG